MTVTDLDTRRPLLGGSTIAAAAGIDPWRSPIRLWLEMTGRLRREETDAMRLGRRLEPLVFDLLDEHGVPCKRTPDAELRDPSAPWLVGHPDGFGEREYDGAVIEAKTTARMPDTLPVYYEAQVQTYMRLCGAPHAVVGMFSFPSLSVWHVEYHPHLADVLIDLGERFVGYLREGVQPPPQGHPDDRPALAQAWQTQAGRKVRESREILEARRELAALVEAEKRRKERIELLRAKVTAYMGDADTLLDAHDNIVATWKEVTSRRVDTKRLAVERPDVHAQYVGETTTRRFLQP